MSKIIEIDLIVTMKFDETNFFILSTNPTYAKKADRAIYSTFEVVQDLQIYQIVDIKNSSRMLPNSPLREH